MEQNQKSTPYVKIAFFHKPYISAAAADEPERKPSGVAEGEAEPECVRPDRQDRGEAAAAVRGGAPDAGGHGAAQGAGSGFKQIFMDHLQMFSDEFITAVFQELKEKQEFVLKYIFKDPNEVWKYIYFITNVIKQIGTSVKKSSASRTSWTRTSWCGS